MKLLYVAPRFHTNQYEAVRALQRAGHKVAFHTIQVGVIEDHSLLKPTILKPCLLSKYLIKLSGRRRNLRRQTFPSPLSYWRLMRDESPDLVIIRKPSHHASLLAACVGRLQGRRIIFYSQQDLHRPVSVRRRLATQAIVRIFDAGWYTPLEGDRKAGNKPLPRHYFVPFAVPQWNKDAPIHDPVRILSIGKFQARKNHLLLLDAFKRLRSQYEFTATLVGQAASTEEVRQLKLVHDRIRAHGLEDIVAVRTNVPFSDMRAIYAEHSLFVLAARREEAGVSVLEAIANGLPAVCSTTCGNRWYIEPGVTGAIFASDCLEDLEAKLRSTLQDAQRLRIMQKACHEFGRSHLSGEAYVAALGRLTEELWGEAL